MHTREKANQEEGRKSETRKATKSALDDREEVHKVDDEDENGASGADQDGEEEYEDDDEAAADEDGDDGGPDDAVDDGNEEGSDPGDAANVDEEDEKDDEEQQQPKAGQKRKSANQHSNGTLKKQKPDGDDGNAPPGKVGSKHMDAEEPAPRGSAERLPKKGQHVQWKAMPGYVNGSVEEILTSAKNVDRKSVKAGKDDPKIVLKSHASGKICVHKPQACFYK